MSDAAAAMPDVWDLEQIKCLKARYCRLLDEKDWSQWRTLFADDFVSDTRASGGKCIAGADDFVSFVKATLGKPGRVTVHQVHAPEITLHSASSASGVWALEDIVRFMPGMHLRGFGHYHETYEKRGNDWKIASSRLTRLRLEIFNGLFSVYIPVSWLSRPQ